MTTHKLKKHKGSWDSVHRPTAHGIDNLDQLAIWIYLVLRPDDWTVRPADIQQHFGIGRDRYQNAINGLKQRGLARWELLRTESGQITSRTLHIYSSAEDCPPAEPEPTERQIRNKPPVEGENCGSAVNASTVQRQIRNKPPETGPLSRIDLQTVQPAAGSACSRLRHPLTKDFEVSLRKDVETKTTEAKTKDLKPPTSKEKDSAPSARNVPKKKADLNFNTWPQTPDPDQWAEILTIRKKKRATNSQRAIDRLGTQLDKAITQGHTFTECMDIWEARQWSGFDASWMDNAQHKGTTSGYKTVGEHNDEVLKNFLAKHEVGDASPDGTTIEGDFTREH